MAVITINIETGGAEPLKVRLTDSIPLRDILEVLKAQAGDRLPKLPNLYVKLSSEKTLAEHGIKDNDTIFAFGEKLVVEILP